MALSRKKRQASQGQDEKQARRGQNRCGWPGAPRTLRAIKAGKKLALPGKEASPPLSSSGQRLVKNRLAPQVAESRDVLDRQGLKFWKPGAVPLLGDPKGPLLTEGIARALELQGSPGARRATQKCRPLAGISSCMRAASRARPLIQLCRHWKTAGSSRGASAWLRGRGRCQGRQACASVAEKVQGHPHRAPIAFQPLHALGTAADLVGLVMGPDRGGHGQGRRRGKAFQHGRQQHIGCAADGECQGLICVEALLEGHHMLLEFSDGFFGETMQ